ncbi:MAG: glutamate formimidoyltransferase [Nitriliruptorales bacterium]
MSEGRDEATVRALRETAPDDVLDVHTDPYHHRSVFTLVGAEAPRRLAAEAVRRIDLRHHDGVHPRIGAVDVVPFVPLDGSALNDALAARDDFCRWAGDELGVPCFRYGPERSLPDVRRQAFGELRPDCGPAAPHPTAGACAVGARPVLVAFNVWLADDDLPHARRVAAAVRRPEVRALGLPVGDGVQVSMNLIDPLVVGPADAYDAVAAKAKVAGAELVGLVPEAVLRAVDPSRWRRLDLSPDRTIEARLAQRAGHGDDSRV